MTLYGYLRRRENLYLKKQAAFEKYMRLSERTMSPKSSLNVPEVRTQSNAGNTREDALLESAEALKRYFEIDDEYDRFSKEFETALAKLNYRDKTILEEVYYWFEVGQDPHDRYKNILHYLEMKKSEVPGAVREAEQHIGEILKDMGLIELP